MDSRREGARAADGATDLTLSRIRQHAFAERHFGPQPHHLLALSVAPLNVRWRTEGAWRHVQTTEPVALFVPRGLSAACQNAGTLDAIHLQISPNRLRALLPEFGDGIEQRPAGNLAGEWVMALATAALAASDQSASLDDLTRDTLLVGVGAVLLNARPLLAEPTVRRGLAPWQLRRVQAKLADELTRDVGLDELAALVGLTPTYLCTAFRESTGLPPHQWQKRRRVEQAKTLLETNSGNVAEIARKVGYSNPSHFATVFKSITGSTPRAWRHERAK